MCGKCSSCWRVIASIISKLKSKEPIRKRCLSFSGSFILKNKRSEKKQTPKFAEASFINSSSEHYAWLFGRGYQRYHPYQDLQVNRYLAGWCRLKHIQIDYEEAGANK